MNKTEKIFYYDSHVKEFEATVLACGLNGDFYDVVLDRTAFYPEGGGQAADKGVLAGHEVLAVYEKDEVVYHRVGASLDVGAMVSGAVDWEFRFSNMQQHSGEHIISGIVNRRWGYDNVGFHIGSDYVTLDFNGLFTEEELEEVEREVNEAIFSNLPLVTSFYEVGETVDVAYRSKKEIDTTLRLITVPGYDVCACCGTHVKLTGEIGIMKIVSAKKYKGGTRVSVLCGFRALDDYRAKHISVTDISVQLSSKPEEVSGAVRQLCETNDSLEYKLKGFKSRIINYIVDGLTPADEYVLMFEDGLEPDDLRQLALGVAEKSPCSVVFSYDGDGGFRYAFATQTGDVRPLCKTINAEFSGRGGGTEKLVQGSLKGQRETITEFLSRHFS